MTNIETEESIEELEKKIQLLELSRINLRVAPVVFDRLNRQAEFKGITIEEHCEQILVDSLNVAVGKPTIAAPSFGAAVGRKVGAPQGGLVTRA
jgi:hypothetical protein